MFASVPLSTIFSTMWCFPVSKEMHVSQPQLWRPVFRIHAAIDSSNTKRKLQRKLKQNVTQIYQTMTDVGVANSAHWIGVYN